MKSSYAPFTCRWAGLLVFLAIFILPGGVEAQAQPTGVLVTPKEGSLEVKWSPAKEAESYKVQWGEMVQADQTYPDEHTVDSGTSYTIPSLDAGTVYVVRVIAVNTSGDESTPSEDASLAQAASTAGATEITPLAGQVQNVMVTAGVSGTSTSLVVSWDPVEGVRSIDTEAAYRVDWGASSATVLASGETRLEINGLLAAIEYTVKVFALNDGGAGPASGEVKGRPKPPAVAQVMADAHADDPQTLTVKWDAQVAAGASGAAAGAATAYKVQWKSGSERFGGDPDREELVTPGTESSLDIPDLDGIQYTVQVIAVNLAPDGRTVQDGPVGTPATGTPKPGMVSAPTVTTHPDPQKLAVSWNAVTGAASYKVEWKEASLEEYSSGNEIENISATRTSIPATGTLDGVPYTVKVTAVNGSGEGMASAEATGTPKPGTVTAVTAVDGVNESRVTWEETRGATRYTVQWRLANGQYNSDDEEQITDPSVTEYVIPDLPAGSYMVQVWASNASGDGLPVETANAATVDAVSENQVTGVRVTAGVKELTVMWNLVANAPNGTKYTVTLSPVGGDEPYTTIRNRAVIRGLTAGTEYSVTVMADVPDVVDEPASSPAVMATPKPGKVPNVEVKVLDDAQQLEVSWGTVTDATGYLVQWKSGTEDYSTSRQVTADADEITALKLTLGDGEVPDVDTPLDGVPHTVQVIATAGTGDDLVMGDPSNSDTGTPKPGTPAPTVTAHDDPGKLTVKWEKVEGATSYKVQWKSEDDADYADTRQATPTALEYTITRGLSAAKEYTVQVIARNASGEGDPSDGPDAEDDVKGKPRPGRVSTVTVAPAAAAGQLDVSWTKVEGATGYKVQWKSGTDDYSSDMRQVTATEGEITARELTLGDGESPALDTPLDGVLHMVQVIATNTASDGNTVQDGPASPAGRGTPKPAVVMSAPTVTVHDEPGKLTVKWEKVEGATRYKVEWKTSDGEYSSNRQASVTALEYTISGLSAANEYVVQVTAMNTSGSSAASLESAELQPRPAQVQNVRVTAPDDAGLGQQLTGEWDAVDGLASTVYIVDCKLATDASFTSLGERTSPAFNFVAAGGQAVPVPGKSRQFHQPRR